MSVVADYPDHQTAVVHIAVDAIQGTPLAGQTIAAGATQTVYSGPVTQLSYILAIDALCQANPVTPVYKCSVIWKDAQGGNQLDIEQWVLLATNVSPANANCLIGIRGPTNAGFVTVLVHNYDTAALTVDAELLQSSRVITKHDGRSETDNISGSYVYGGFTFPTPVSAPANLILGCSPGITVPAGGTAARINALFSGAMHLWWTAGGAAGVTAAVYEIHPDFVTPVQQANAPAVGLTAVTGARGPLLIVWSNSGGSPATVIYSLTGQEFAS